MQGETDLEMAHRHIREGELRVVYQGEIIDKLRQDGHPTLQAESLLVMFEHILGEFRDHLHYLEMRDSRLAQPSG